MTKPKAKAKQLVKFFQNLVMYDHRYDEMPFFSHQKLCALKVVKECMENSEAEELREYWGQVKKEINKLIK